MQEPRKQTTEQHQRQEALQVKHLARDIRFRIIGRPAEHVLELSCASCAHTFHIRVAPQNFFFTCSVCRIIGNLPGVLAAQVDRECEGDSKKEEKKQRLDEIKMMFPPPEPIKMPPPQVRRQST